MKKYSHIICIGDSFTNEKEHYRRVGLLDTFKELDYEFKSYPELLADHYNCDYTLFGEPGKTITFTIQELIKNINWILTLENPLVLYQFGYFMNADLKFEGEVEHTWKDFIDERKKPANNISVNQKNELVDTLSTLDKLSITNWFEKFEEYRNYYFIDIFLTLVNHIKEIKNIDVFGFFHTEPKFKIPIHKNLLWLFDEGYGISGLREKTDSIDYYLKNIKDGHKSTQGNNKLAQEIINQINLKS